MKNSKDSQKNSQSLLGEDEQKVIEGLVTAWNEFVKIEKLHPDEQDEFRHLIHSAQYMIMSRPMRREYRDRFPE